MPHLAGFVGNPVAVSCHFSAPWIHRTRPIRHTQHLLIHRRKTPRMCAPPEGNRPAISKELARWWADEPETPPMRWGRLGGGETCTYCDGSQIVDCPSCGGEGVHGRTIVCRYCAGQKRLPCPLCSEVDAYGWSYGSHGASGSDENGGNADSIDADGGNPVDT